MNRSNIQLYVISCMFILLTLSRIIFPYIKVAYQNRFKVGDSKTDVFPPKSHLTCT